MLTRTRLFALSLVAATVLFSSCQKTEIEPQTSMEQSGALAQPAEAVQSGEEQPPVLPMIRK
ncbi:MAG: hypothetical protein LH606_06595 [Cytophagaceae bacterium]|nr:hypothetical protein [Cytophagaceae bacterium]